MVHTKLITATCLSLLFLPSTLRAQEEVTAQDEITGTTRQISVPDGMTSHATDSLIQSWYSRSYLITDENCQASSTNPSFTKEEYINRLSRLPNVIEMPYNDVVRKFIDRYAEKDRRSVSYMLGACNFYMPIFEQALEEYHLPLELKYLPVIECSLNPQETSNAGAAGLWQFIPSTAKLYGMEVTSLVDDRLDAVKASRAAARYLREMYDIFGDWTLVVASYNCGPGTLNKAIKRAGGVNNYWKIYNYLPKETQGYVPAFIAANYIMNYYCEHGICPVQTTLPAGTDTIIVNRDVRFEQINEMCGVSMDELKALNPQYRTTLVPGGSRPCAIRLSPAAMNAFLEAGDTVYTHRASELFNKKEVEISETGSPSSASRYSNYYDKNKKTYQEKTEKEEKVYTAEKVEKEEKASENKSSKSSSSKSSSKGKSSSKSSSKSKSGSSTITIKEGDNLGAIAKRNGTTVEKLKKLNGLKDDKIRAGKTLRVK